MVYFSVYGRCTRRLFRASTVLPVNQHFFIPFIFNGKRNSVLNAHVHCLEKEKKYIVSNTQRNADRANQESRVHTNRMCVCVCVCSIRAVRYSIVLESTRFTLYTFPDALSIRRAHRIPISNVRASYHNERKFNSNSYSDETHDHIYHNN